MSYAGIATRGVALVIDAAIINVAALIAGGAINLITSLFGGDLNLDAAGALVAGGGWLFWVGLYFTTFWVLTGQTPGDRALGIRVEGADGGSLGTLQALRRFAGLVIAALPLGIGFVPVLFDERRRGLHDLIGGTVVRWVAAEASAGAPREAGERETQVAEAPEPRLRPGGAPAPGAPPPPGS